jgi:hypothetical protein
MHGGAAPQTRAKAQERILAAADPAAANLVRWMGDPKIEMRLRIQIAQDLLDRAGISGKTSVEIDANVTFNDFVAGVVASVDDGTEIANFHDYSRRLDGADIVDAEVIEETYDDKDIDVNRIPRSLPPPRVPEQGTPRSRKAHIGDR